MESVRIGPEVCPLWPEHSGVGRRVSRSLALPTAGAAVTAICLLIQGWRMSELSITPLL